MELHSFQILSTENCLFPFSLLPDGPSEDAKAPGPQISQIPEAKVTCWDWGHGCGAAMPAVISLKCFSPAQPVGCGGAAAPTHCCCGHCWALPHLGGDLGAQLLLPPSPPSSHWKLFPCFSLEVPVVEGFSPSASVSEQPLQMFPRLAEGELLWRWPCTLLSPVAGLTLALQLWYLKGFQMCVWSL